MFEDDFLIFKVEYVSFLEGIYHIFFQVEAKIYIYMYNSDLSSHG